MYSYLSLRFFCIRYLRSNGCFVPVKAEGTNLRFSTFEGGIDNGNPSVMVNSGSLDFDLTLTSRS